MIFKQFESSLSFEKMVDL